jgi:hypothetical protein
LVLFTTVLVELALLIRLAMKLVAADPESHLARSQYSIEPSLAKFTYTVTDPLLFPFSWIRTNPSAEGSVLAIPTLAALLAYGLLGWIIGHIILRIFEERRLARLRDFSRRDS